VPERNVHLADRIDTRQDPVSRRFDFHRRFVGFNLQQRFAFAHTLAFFFSPRQQFPSFLRHLQRRHHHTDCHSFSVATISVRRRYSFRFRARFHHFFHAPAWRLFVFAR